MNQDEEDGEERNAIASTWLLPVEPHVEIEESENALEMDEKEDESDEEQSSDSEEENNVQAVRELESVLVDKTCEVCGNLFQAFELVNAESKKPLLSTCETCSYYITPPVVSLASNSPLVVSSLTKLNEYSCDKCSKIFNKKDKLEKHKVIHTNLKLFSCDSCDKSFKRQDKLTEHLSRSHGEKGKSKREKCITCGSIDNIITINVGENEAECIKLCESCNLSRQEQIAKLNQNNSKVFSCDLCHRVFSRRDHALRHRLSHLDIKPFNCSICKKSFSRNDRLLRHMKTHPGAKPFSCKVCSKAFADREKLKIHLSTHPRWRGKPVKCEICHKEMRDKDRLQRHLATHKNYKPFVCEKCGKTFKLRGALLAHQQMHSDSNPYKCDVCGLQFKVKMNLTRHKLVHSSDKNYSCDICKKTFRRKDKLQTHNLVHIDIKPYSCNMCKSAFKRKDKYIRHMRQVHQVTSSSEVTCTLCGLTFECEDDLSEHKMIHFR